MTGSLSPFRRWRCPAAPFFARDGDINGRRPKLTDKKSLIIQTTIFDKRAYDAGLRDAMRLVIDEFTLTYPGIKHVEHEYFYAVHGADDATRRRYLERAYTLGREF